MLVKDLFKGEFSEWEMEFYNKREEPVFSTYEKDDEEIVKFFEDCGTKQIIGVFPAAIKGFLTVQIDI